MRSVVPPAAGLHTYTWCTTSARNPLSLSLSLLHLPSSPFLRLPLLSQPFPPSPARPFGLRSFHARLRAFCPAPFSSLTTIFAFVGRKRGRWMNRRRAQGRGTSRRRTPATGFGGQTGDRVSRESRSTIHFYPALFFLSLSVSFFLSFFLSPSSLTSLFNVARIKTLSIRTCRTIIRGKNES